MNRFPLGLTIAFLIMGIWGISLEYLGHIAIDGISWYWLIFAVLWQTWLYTGLFITAHDAIHGNVCPGSLGVNRGIGTVCLWLFAGFEYQPLSIKHQLHHKYPTTPEDPDYHNGVNDGFWAWYSRFVCEHLSYRQIINLFLIMIFYLTLVKISIVNIILFALVPSVLSSLQLFYFGTFLPHQRPLNGYYDRHCAITINRSWAISLLTCYHFGYHYEHHVYPNIPWWKLPITFINQK
jgi:beta-carotene ketolase (CrtW type)